MQQFNSAFITTSMKLEEFSSKRRLRKLILFAIVLCFENMFGDSRIKVTTSLAHWLRENLQQRSQVSKNYHQPDKLEFIQDVLYGIFFLTFESFSDYFRMLSI